MRLGRLVFTMFIVLQIADGLLTYGAVSAFGSDAEGNPLLRTWMHLAGPGAALVGAKLLAVGCGTVLYSLGITRVLGWLTALYLFAAVGPWLHIYAR
jgi:hypothetical protein